MPRPLRAPHARPLRLPSPPFLAGRTDDLQGASLEQLVAEAAAGQKPRLYLIDYWGLGHYWHDSSAAAANGNGNASGAAPKAVQHAGRALFYLKK